MLTDGRTDGRTDRRTDGRKVITIAHPEQSSGKLKIGVPASAMSARTLWSHQAQSSTVCQNQTYPPVAGCITFVRPGKTSPQTSGHSL